jgi:hypothetical protein
MISLSVYVVQGFKISKAWNLNASLRYSSEHISRKSQEDTKKLIQRRKENNNWDTRLGSTLKGQSRKDDCTVFDSTLLLLNTPI